MRILHFSDFHLDKAPNSIGKSQKLLDAMLSSLRPFLAEKPIDLVIFTGDMVNVGGKSFDDILQGFEIFKNLISAKLMNELSLPAERFIFCPGNHDVDRDKDNKYSEKGLVEDLKDIESLEKFYDDKKSIEVMQRIIPFKDFEKRYYQNINNISFYPTNFQSNFILHINNKKIGITSLNTSWRCYDSKTDKGKILMCARQIEDSVELLKECDIKIALSHHSYTWMNDFEALQLEKFITCNYDMYFSGHTHSSNAEYCIKPEGRTFKMVAPGIMSANVFEKAKNFRNGFSLIDYDIDKGYVETILFYQNDLSAFVVDKNHGFNGIWHIDIPLGKEQQKHKDIQDVIISMKEELENLNQHLLSYKTNSCAPKSLNKIFVMPEITIKKIAGDDDSTQDFEEETIKNLDDIINSTENYILFGIKESGKTILLDKLLLEFLNRGNVMQTLPAYIKFSSIKTDIETCIREYWHQKKSFSMPLIEHCNIVLLVDDIVFSDGERMSILAGFMKQYPKSRFIGTCLETQKNDLMLDAYTYPEFNYQRAEINEFNSRQIRELAHNWIGENIKSNEQINKIELLINAFSSVDLPRTPFAISMFLWILERQDNYKPQNSTILIKQFLESLLQSNEMKGAPREQFDYINKSNLLAVIAKEMLDADNPNYSLTSSKVLNIIERHLADLRFEFYNARRELANFLDLGIFVEDGHSNITFRFTCFFEYYLFVYMELEPQFKKYVLTNENCLRFYNEIIYYTGIHRNEISILKMIIEGMEYDYIDINHIVFNKVKSIDDFFNINRSFIQELNVDDLIKVLPNKQTEEEKESQENAMLTRKDNSKNQGIIAKKSTDKFTNYGKILLLAMNVLKNLEEIKEDGLKKSYYTEILKNSISYMILFKMICEEMISHSSKFPKERIEDLQFCIRLLPVLHEELIKSHMGTYKLTQVIREKIREDENSDDISEMERFLSVFLYIDLNGTHFKEELNRFINNFKRAYIADACFFKLSGYYYASKDSSLDQIYLNALADMYIKTHKSNKNNKIIEKSKVIKMLTQKRVQNKLKQE